MHPEAATLWRGSRWSLSLLLACLSMLGPFAIDTYLPAFAGIESALGSGPVQMQQTLSVFLLGFAVMNLFHGALSDSLGRRPVVLGALAVFTLASIGCALSPTMDWLLAFRALQGLSAGGGMVVSRAIIRDMFAPADAQRAMSQVTIFFGIAPAIAPMVGGVLFEVAGWRSVFWFLAALSAALALLMAARLPESLHIGQRQSLHLRPLLAAYWRTGTSARFLVLALASAVPFNAMFVYVLGSPLWLGQHLGLQPTQFWWFFVLSVGGIMAGAWCSGRLAGRVAGRRQVAAGFAVMVVACAVNLVLNAALRPHVAWALLPVMAISFGWALVVPIVTLMLLDLMPERRGLASSVQSFLGAVLNAVVAGVVVPLVMHAALDLAAASAAFTAVGLVCWWWVRRRLP